MGISGLLVSIPEKCTTPVLVAAGVTILLLHSLWSWYRLSHIPGPRFHGLSLIPMLRSQLSGEVHLLMKDWSSKHGPLVRVGPNAVITSDVKSMVKISGYRSRYSKGDWYRPMRFMRGQDTSFSMVDEAGHTALRTKVMPAYAGSKAVEALVDAQVERMVDMLSRKYAVPNASGAQAVRAVDFAALTHFFSLDVIGSLQFGQAFGFLDECEDVFGFLKWGEDLLSVAAVSGVLTGMEKMLQFWPFSELMAKPTDPQGLGPFIARAQKIMAKRYSAGYNDEKDMIGMFMKHGVNENEAASQATLQVVAGTDSVATAIRMTILYLSANARAMALLRAELDDAEAKGLMSTPVQNAEARKLPYLQAVVREGLRMYPGVIPLGNKTVPPGGDVVAGYRLPAGTQVGLASWGAMRDTAVWGEDADMFRPERWLNLDKDTAAAWMECLDFQFGYGRYQCLGRALVFTEMNKAVTALVQNFDFACVDPVRPAKIVSASFYLMKDFNMAITPRKKAISESQLDKREQCVEA